MNKKISLGAAIAFAILIAAVTFALTWTVSTGTFSGMVGRIGQQDAMSSKLNEIDSYVRDNYIGKLDDQTLVDDAAVGYMIGTGDRYAAYYSPEQWKEQQAENAGTLTGIGVVAKTDENGYVVVTTVYENSPAAAADIQAGDLIVGIDGTDIKGKSLDEAVNMIRGEAGTSVDLVTRRDGADSKHTITRQKMEIPNVSYHKDGDNGYIKINSFTDAAADQFVSAVKDLQGQGVRALVFDLRDNGGGTIDSVSKMLDFLLPEGVLVTETTADGTTNVLSESDAEKVDLPMVVLVNGNTASASELFACDLRDFGVAQLVGTTSYGKGVLQTTKPLSDGSAVKITTAYFNPAKSENFNGKGLTPDYEVKLDESQQQQWNSSKLQDADDPQYQKAMEVANASR